VEISNSAELKAAVRDLKLGAREVYSNVGRFSVVHGDLNPYNVYFNGGSIGIIDFELSHAGCPEEDTANFLKYNGVLIASHLIAWGSDSVGLSLLDRVLVD
jgi:aminoglycoside phosphotransferase (APT) family kinase protein